MDPTLPDWPEPPRPAPPRPGGALAFFLVLFGLVLPDLVAQASSRMLGLAWSELFAILLPALVAVAGSNLRLARYLGLDRVRPVHLLLGAALGAAAFLPATGVQIAWVALLPRRILEAFPDVAQIFEGSRAQQLVLAAVAVGLAPLCEEIAFRGYLQRTLARALAPGPAIALTAGLFAVRHLDLVRFPALVLLGAVFGWAAWRSGSLWPAVVAHAANNAVATFLVLSPAARPDPAAAAPGLQDALWPLALGAAALAFTGALFRLATPAPPAAGEAVALRDPGDPSTRFRPERVPLALVRLGFLGLVLLGVLVARSPWWRGAFGP